MRRLLVSVAVSSLFAVAATVSAPLTPSFASAPVRYRDNVFTTVQKRADITYGTAIDEIDHSVVTLKLDLYTPKGDTLNRRPVIVWVHGGSFCCLNKSSPELIDQATQFALKGYVNVSIDYRLAHPGCVPGGGGTCLIGIRMAMQDAQTAVRYLRSRRQVRDRPVAHRDRWLVGRRDHRGQRRIQLREPRPGQPPEVLLRGAGGAVALRLRDRCRAGTGRRARDLLPRHRRPARSLLVCAGTVAKAKAAGDKAILRTWPGEGHVPYVENRAQILTQTGNFFYKHLDLAHAPT